MGGHHGLRGGGDARHLGKGSIFEVPWIRRRHLNSADPLHRCIEIVESCFLNARADFRRDASAAPAFIDDERAMRSPHGL